MLTGQLGFPELNPIIAHIDMGHQKTGKIEFAKVLGLLESDQRGFIRYLSTLRNDLVHNVSRVSFDFYTYATSLNRDQKNNFIAAVQWSYTDEGPAPEEYKFKTMRDRFWIAGLYTLGLMHMKTLVARRRHEGREIAQRIADQVLVQQKRLQAGLSAVLVPAAAKGQASAKPAKIKARKPDGEPSDESGG